MFAYVTINIDPVIGHLGPFTVRWYGVIMSLAVIVGCWIFSRQAAQRGIAGEHALGIMVISIPLGLIGARLVHVFEDMGYFWHHPGQIFGTDLVGLAIYGVLAGGLGGLLIYCWWKKLPVLKVLDATALAFPVAQVIGRCANIINGDTWGYRTGLPWGLVYKNPHAFLPANLLGVPTQPTPIYEQLWLLVMIGILLYFMPRLRKVDGLAIIAYLGLYSFGRFFLSYLRVNKILFLGLREAQVIGLITLALIVPATFYLLRRARREARERRPATARRRRAGEQRRAGGGAGRWMGGLRADGAADRSQRNGPDGPHILFIAGAQDAYTSSTHCQRPSCGSPTARDGRHRDHRPGGRACRQGRSARWPDGRASSRRSDRRRPGRPPWRRCWRPGWTPRG